MVSSPLCDVRAVSKEEYFEEECKPTEEKPRKARY